MSPQRSTIPASGPGDADEPRWSNRTKSRFEALQHAIAPISAGFDESRRRTSLALVDRTLRNQPRAVRRQLAWLMTAIDLYCLCRHRRVFRKLPNAARQRVIEDLAHARPALLRQGMEGLATLAKLGAYGQPSLYPALGYRLRENPDG